MQRKYILVEVPCGDCAGIVLHRYECLRVKDGLTMFIAFDEDDAKYLLNKLEERYNM